MEERINEVTNFLFPDKYKNILDMHNANLLTDEQINISYNYQPFYFYLNKTSKELKYIIFYNKIRPHFDKYLKTTKNCTYARQKILLDNLYYVNIIVIHNLNKTNIHLLNNNNVINTLKLISINTQYNFITGSITKEISGIVFKLQLILLFDIIGDMVDCLDIFIKPLFENNKCRHISMSTDSQIKLNYNWGLSEIIFHGELNDKNQLNNIYILSYLNSFDVNFLRNSNLVSLHTFITEISDEFTSTLYSCTSLNKLFITHISPIDLQQFTNLCNHPTINILRTWKILKSIDINNIMKIAFIDAKIQSLEIEYVNIINCVDNINFINTLRLLKNIKLKIATVITISCENLLYLFDAITKNNISLRCGWHIINVCEQQKLHFVQNVIDNYCDNRHVCKLLLQSMRKHGFSTEYISVLKKYNMHKKTLLKILKR